MQQYIAYVGPMGARFVSKSAGVAIPTGSA